jgi:hypothetical protein
MSFYDRPNKFPPATTTFPDRREIISEVSEHSPILRACLLLWQREQCTWEQAILLAVRELARACDEMAGDMFRLSLLAGPPPLPLSPETEAKLRQQIQEQTARKTALGPGGRL